VCLNGPKRPLKASKPSKKAFWLVYTVV
jgi:hypothetical protein